MKENLGDYVDREVARAKKFKLLKDAFSGPTIPFDYPAEAEDLSLMSGVWLMSEGDARAYIDKYKKVAWDFEHYNAPDSPASYAAMGGFLGVVGSSLTSSLAILIAGRSMQTDVIAALATAAATTAASAMIGYAIGKKAKKNRESAIANLPADFEAYKQYLSRAPTDFHGVEIPAESLRLFEKEYGHVSQRLERARKHFEFYRNLVAENGDYFEPRK